MKRSKLDKLGIQIDKASICALNLPRDILICALINYKDNGNDIEETVLWLKNELRKRDNELMKKAVKEWKNEKSI